MKLTIFLTVYLISTAQSFFFSGSSVINLTDKNFNSTVISDAKLALVLFYSPLCQRCKMLSPEFEQLATELKDLAIIAAVNVDKNNVP